MHSENQYALRALNLGALGHLTKDSAPDELVKAIRKVGTGETYFGSSLSARLVLNLATDTGQSRHQALSEREYRILCMIASGKSVRGISHALSVSPRTIWTYRARILEKMAMKNNPELIQYAIRRGMVGETSRNGDRLPAPGPE
jgi:two-component system invasion response regulator UvrY